MTLERQRKRRPDDRINEYIHYMTLGVIATLLIVLILFVGVFI